ncbi:hypothetical protein D9Q98_007259 [Chlorella vulgaris]|uniref:Isocitrate lyase n=1 Tax=Chlorella vulgaris TaxID=3077 RepID=A0A9D4TL13_CHLVU|nr:hypothetical protein D9Q98_007259 [Chlorella vulgaris]
MLQQPGILLGPCCHDGLSARLIEQAGFDFAFMSGFCTAAARLGVPDTGLISYAEMADTARNCCEATRHIPIIGDGDTGYGNAVNVKRTVVGYAAAGLAGVLIEDQQWPKSCGHVRNKRVVDRAEALARIRAACDARDEGRDIVVVARTDARQAESLEEALYRAAAFADAGADVVFIDALESEGEMQALCRVPGAHKMASMLEGGGKTPILEPTLLQAMGFKLCAYPLSLLGVSVRAMEGALQGLKAGVVPAPPAMPTFPQLQAAVGFPEYFQEEARYAVPPAGSSGTASTSGTGHGSSDATDGAGSSGVEATSAAAAVSEAAAAAPPAAAPQESAGIEPDAVLEPDGSSSSSSSSSSQDAADAAAGSTINLYQSQGEGEEGQGGYRARNPSSSPQWLRVRITDTRADKVTLDTRIPAGFLSSAASLIPASAGVDLEGLVRQATGDAGWDSSKPVYRFDSNNDKFEVFLEY